MCKIPLRCVPDVYHKYLIKSIHVCGGKNNLVLRFPERPFSGLVVEATSPPIIFAPAIFHGWIMPIIFIFTILLVQHLDLESNFLGIPFFS